MNKGFHKEEVRKFKNKHKYNLKSEDGDQGWE